MSKYVGVNAEPIHNNTSDELPSLHRQISTIHDSESERRVGIKTPAVMIGFLVAGKIFE